MQHASALVLFPAADSTTLIAVAVCFVLLFAVAIVADRYRHRNDEHRRARSEWVSVGTIALEKGLSETEKGALEALIKRWSPRQPRKLATTRPLFSEAVEKELAAIQKQGDKAEHRRRAVVLRDLRERLGLDYVPYGKPIDSTRDLFVGQQVDVGPAVGGRGTVLRVAGVDEAFFSLGLVRADDDRADTWQPGDEYAFTARREDDGVYRWRSVLDRADDKPRRWIFQHNHGLTREQKREHYRVRYDDTIDVELVHAPSDGVYDGIKNTPPIARIRARVTSLSAGGLALEVNQALPREVSLRVALPLKEIGVARGDARVVTSTLLSGGRMSVRAEFVHLADGAEDAIAKFVLERQKYRIARPAPTAD